MKLVCDDRMEWVAGDEVGLRIGAREPVTEFDPEPCEHPELLP